MEPRVMIETIIRQYEELQNVNPVFRNRVGLIRKSNHIIGSYLEDIVAAYVFDLLHTEQANIEIWVDQVFLLGPRQQFKPDITIIRVNREGREIIGFIEVKESANQFRFNNPAHDEHLGIAYIDKRIARLNSLRGVVYNSMLEYKVHNRRIVIPLNANAKFDLVLVSDRLFSERNLNRLHDYCTNEEISPFLAMHILLSGIHPNPKYSRPQLTAEQLIEIIRPDQITFESFNHRIEAIAEI